MIFESRRQHGKSILIPWCLRDFVVQNYPGQALSFFAAQCRHRCPEHLPAMLHVAEHIEAGAGRGEQDDAVRMGQRIREVDGLRKRCGVMERKIRIRGVGRGSDQASAASPITTSAFAMLTTASPSSEKSSTFARPPAMSTGGVAAKACRAMRTAIGVVPCESL